MAGWIRSGWWTLIAGFLISAIGAAVLENGGFRWEGRGQFIHTGGLLVMLAGAIVLLVSYRVRLIQSKPELPVTAQAIPDPHDIVEAMMEDTSDQQLLTGEKPLPRSTGRHAGTDRYEKFRKQEAVTRTAFFIGVILAICFVATILPMFGRTWFAALGITVVTFTVTTCCIIGLIYGTSWAKTFAIGMLVPLSLSSLQLLVVMASVFNVSARAMNLQSYVFMWYISIGMGGAAMLMRMAVEPRVK